MDVCIRLSHHHKSCWQPSAAKEKQAKENKTTRNLPVCYRILWTQKIRIQLFNKKATEKKNVSGTMHCPLKKHGATIDWSSSQALDTGRGCVCWCLFHWRVFHFGLAFGIFFGSLPKFNRSGKPVVIKWKSDTTPPNATPTGNRYSSEL